VHAQDAGVDAFAELAAQGRWEELLDASGARLADAPEDVAALYWSGRAHLVRGQALLPGPRFAQELGRSLLHAAAAQLGAVPGDVDAFADAPEWAMFARYLAGDDETLAADLERAATAGSGYAARLRGWLARDRGESSAEVWFARGAERKPDDADVRLEWATELAAVGQRPEALAVLEQARLLGADREGWLAALAATLPRPEDAEELLQRLQPLQAESGSERDAPLAALRARALDRLGRAAEAEAVLALATEGRRPDIELLHARLLLRLMRPEEAADLMAPLAEAGDAEALDMLVSAADVLAQSFRWDEALATYELALSIEPAHARAAANRALTQARAGRALDGYQALVSAYPQRADVLNDAALAEAGRGDVPAAQLLLERAAAMPIDEASARDARENLAALLLSGPEVDAIAAMSLLRDVLDAEPGRDRALSLRLRARRLTR
jgi:Flp pilus assembly protein TadD